MSALERNFAWCAAGERGQRGTSRHHGAAGDGHGCAGRGGGDLR